MRRKRLSRKRSSKLFRKGMRSKRKNLRMRVPRGGIAI